VETNVLFSVQIRAKGEEELSKGSPMNSLMDPIKLKAFNWMLHQLPLGDISLRQEGKLA
jgi:hypothetical protein